MAKGTVLAFQIKDALEGVTERVRRAIGQATFDAPHLLRIRAACERLKLKWESPCYLSDCWAHIGIPKLKLAIYCRDFLETVRINKARASWEKNGWVMIAITISKIERMSDEQLVEQLKAALVELGKLKR